jgi:hypothetical protein
MAIFKGKSNNKWLDLPYLRTKTTTNASKDAVKQEPLYTVGGNVN